MNFKLKMCLYRISVTSLDQNVSTIFVNNIYIYILGILEQFGTKNYS